MATNKINFNSILWGFQNILIRVIWLLNFRWYIFWLPNEKNIIFVFVVVTAFGVMNVENSWVENSWIFFYFVKWSNPIQLVNVCQYKPIVNEQWISFSTLLRKVAFFVFKIKHFLYYHAVTLPTFDISLSILCICIEGMGKGFYLHSMFIFCFNCYFLIYYLSR